MRGVAVGCDFTPDGGGRTMQLRVSDTVIDVFDYCWRERAALVRFGSVPLAISIAAAFVALALDLTQTPTAPASLLIAAVPAIVYLPASVTWYRMIVLGDAEARTRPLFTLGRLEWRLLWWQIVIIVALIAVVAVGGASSDLPMDCYGRRAIPQRPSPWPPHLARRWQSVFCWRCAGRS